jgi:hypothetical protein
MNKSDEASVATDDYLATTADLAVHSVSAR